MDDWNVEQIHVFAERLRGIEAELMAQIEQRREASAAVELDQTKVGRLLRMDALQQQAMSQASDQRATQQLVRVRAAMTRLSEGRYGRCLSCSHPLLPARLEADPCAVLCMDCQQDKDEESAREARREGVLGRRA